MIHRYIYLLETVQLFSEKHQFINNINHCLIIPSINQSYIHFKYYSSGLGIISAGKIKWEDENDNEINYDYDEYFSIQIPANTIPVDLYNQLFKKSKEHRLLT
jgi:hypothetical protein